MNQAESLQVGELEQAFELFNRVSLELDTSYRDLESRVAELTGELVAVKSARLREYAEKQRLAHRLSILVSVLPGGVLVVNVRGLIRDANPQAIELLGEPLMGQLWEKVLQRVSDPDQSGVRDRVLHSGKRISVVTRSLDESGDHVILITDVSEIHHLQEQLGRGKRLTAMGEMAARLAHQIRTPLSSTALYLSQLSRHDLAAEQRQKISGKVGERLNHMGALVDSMLSFVRGETPAKNIVYLNDVLRDFEAVLRPQLETSRSTLLIPNIDNTLVIIGDQDELVGALSNLAMNALEAIDGETQLELWVGALNNDWLQIRFRDNGPGIPEDILDRLFDPFFTTRARGTGLGLAVVAMTVSNHGGEISARNRTQGGAEFVIDLPIMKPAATGHDEPISMAVPGDSIHE
jgi:two-component system sensor histidine kinase FlrB